MFIHEPLMFDWIIDDCMQYIERVYLNDYSR